MRFTAFPSLVRGQRRRHVLGGAVAAWIVIAAGTWAALSLLLPDIPVVVHVRWDAEVTEAERRDLERRFSLADSEQQDGTTWRYRLRDRSRDNIRALVLHARVDDTAYLHRTKYRPAFAMDRSRRILVFSLVSGVAASILFLVLGPGGGAARLRGAAGRAGRSLLDVLRLPPITSPGGVRLGATAWVVAAAVLVVAAMGILAGTSVV